MKQSSPGVRTACAALAAVAWTGTTPVAAQEYPAKPIRMIIGFPPGGSNDIVARIVGPRVAELLGQQIVIENRPGANATIATEYVARSAPDGYTILLGSVSPLVLSLFTYSKLGYDTPRDLAGIGTVAMTPELVAVHPSLPARSLKELVALAKTQPGKLTFASSGNGGLPHLAIELFKSVGQVNLLHVPYKGAAPAVTDLLGGHVTGIIMDFPPLLPHVKAEKMRALAVAAQQRTPLLPNLPTTGEQGMPRVIAVNWFAIVAPIKTPRAVQERLHAAFTKAATAADMTEKLRAQGVEPMTSASPEAFTKFLQGELQRWGEVAKTSGARSD
jgi:tripartite-type tricarboxylate transporter receptor subunit TctC